MKPLTEKQKKTIWIAVGALAFLHFFLPRILSMFHSHPQQQVQAKPSPLRLAPPPPPPPSPEVAAAIKYGGVWLGETITPDENKCSLKLEIRLDDELPKKLKGYASKSCVPLQGIARGPITRGTLSSMIRNSTPSSVIMTGTPQPTGISFTVDQAIGTEMNGCTLSALSITDFGNGQVAAQWQEGTCTPGRMMLFKKG